MMFCLIFPGSVEPTGDCCLLEQNSEVIVAPKARPGTAVKKPTSQAQSQEPEGQGQSSGVSNEPGHNPEEPATSDKEGSNQEASEDSSLNEAGTTAVRSRLGSTLAYLSSMWHGAKKDGIQKSKVEADIDITPKHFLSADLTFDTSLRVAAAEHFAVQNDDTGGINLLKQPTNVYISSQTFLEGVGSIQNNTELPSCFIALIKKILSPNEKMEMAKKEQDRQSRARALGSEHDKKTGETSPFREVTNDQSQTPGCIVRVVVVEKALQYNVNGGVGKLSKWLPPKHVLIGRLMRKQLGLDVTGRIRIQRCLQNTFVPEVDAVAINPLAPLVRVPASNLPLSIF